MPDARSPQRIHRQRTKGWKMPPNTVYVGRPGKWGNPWTVSDYYRAGYSGNGFDALRMIVETYRAWIAGTDRAYMVLYLDQMGRPSRVPPDVQELRGKDLACWCPLDQPCHADVLLELANA